jgi:hypothetical protein
MFINYFIYQSVDIVDINIIKHLMILLFVKWK